MIAHLRGKLLSKSPTSSILECQGVGYEVLHSPHTAESLTSQEVSLFIYTHVREDLLVLFGFSTAEERDFFKELLKVSAIGPKLALSILSGIQYKELVLALQNKDIARLQKIPGIGKKTAERMSIELADRMLKNWKASDPTSVNQRPPSNELELESILVNLGYQTKEISKVVERMKPDLKDQALESVVKKALGELTAIKKMRAH